MPDGWEAVRDQIAQLQAEVKATAEPNAELIEGAVKKALDEQSKVAAESTATDEVKRSEVEEAEKKAAAHADAVKRAALDPNTHLKSLLYGSGAGALARVDQGTKALHDANDALLLGMNMQRVVAQTTGKVVDPKAMPVWHEFQALAQKALTTTVASSGDEFVPTAYTEQWSTELRMTRRLKAAFTIESIPRSPYERPARASTGGLPYLISESTGDTGAKIQTRTPTTRKVTFTCAVIGERIVWNRWVDEDWTVDAANFIRGSLMDSMDDGYDTALLNGDTAGQVAGSHMDGVIAVVDCRAAINGLRKLAQSPATDTHTDLATFTQGAVVSLRTKMGEAGINPRDLVQVCGLKVYSKMLADATNFNNLHSMEKIGSDLALNIVGEMGAIYGVPLIVSPYVFETCTNAAVCADTSGTDGLMVTFNRTRYVIGMERDLLIETVYDAETQQYKLIGSSRFDMQPLGDATTELSVSVGYNIDVS